MYLTTKPVRKKAKIQAECFILEKRIFTMTTRLI